MSFANLTTRMVIPYQWTGLNFMNMDWKFIIVVDHTTIH